MIFKRFSGLNLFGIQAYSPSHSIHPFLIPVTASATLLLGIVTFGLEANAANMSIGNEGLQFEQDTTLESEFIESHGAYQSTFGVMNLKTKEKTPLLTETRSSDQNDTIFRSSSKVNDAETELDFRGTPGSTVTQTSAQFTFKAKDPYVFYLESSYNGRPTGVVYSNDVMNPNREQQVTFTGNVSELCQNGIVLAWDDTGSRLVRDRQQQDRDFDDFLVRLRNTACPIGGGEVEPRPAAKVATGGRFPAALALLPGLFLFSGGGGGRDTSRTPPPSGAVPEPMTVLASAGAIGFTAMLHRRRKRRKQD